MDIRQCLAKHKWFHILWHDERVEQLLANFFPDTLNLNLSTPLACLSRAPCFLIDVELMDRGANRSCRAAKGAVWGGGVTCPSLSPQRSLLSKP